MPGGRWGEKGYLGSPEFEEWPHRDKSSKEVYVTGAGLTEQTVDESRPLNRPDRTVKLGRQPIQRLLIFVPWRLKNIEEWPW